MATGDVSLYDLLDDRGRLAVRVTPKSSSARIKIETLADGRHQVRAYVTVVPEDGKANAAVMELLAKALGVPKSSLSLVSGATARDKVFQVGR